MPTAEEAVEVIRRAHPQNGGYLDDLLEDLKRPGGIPLVPFIGAGLSVPLGVKR